ncbi:MAG: sigma-54-dependent Fis family transcriptional regulator [Acidobacteria bacterium]|nr:sigma-54-dependent Fis family transcriptional regulator [Acidobacteriota bacterium]
MTHEPHLPSLAHADKRPEHKRELCVLLVDDQHSVCDACSQAINVLGYRPLTAGSAAEALDVMDQQQVDIVIADIETGIGGTEMLQELKRRNRRVQVALMTPAASVSTALEALHSGVSGYIVKPFTTEEVRVLTRRLAQSLTVNEDRPYHRTLDVRYQCARMVGQSQAMRQVFKTIEKVSRSRAPVLILGETGTGKDLAARAIHETGTLRDRPFVPVDCGALAPTLIESELFGHIRGAFTGAVQNKVGLLESAKDGTVFLDEVGELPVELQSRLLRTIQEKELRPVGGTQRVRFAARIIAATNRNLKEAVAKGTFRKDLYFRLNVVSMTLPPLRERRIDIPLLIEQTLLRLAQSEAAMRGHAPWLLSSEVLDRLLTYEWPGNVRELENCLERAVTMASGPLIEMKDLPSTLQPSARPLMDSPQAVIPLDEMERQAIERAMESTGGDKLMAARLLGIGKTTLYRKLSKYQQGG